MEAWIIVILAIVGMCIIAGFVVFGPALLNPLNLSVKVSDFFEWRRSLPELIEKIQSLNYADIATESQTFEQVWASTIQILHDHHNKWNPQCTEAWALLTEHTVNFGRSDDSEFNFDYLRHVAPLLARWPAESHRWLKAIPKEAYKDGTFLDYWRNPSSLGSFTLHNASSIDIFDYDFEKDENGQLSRLIINRIYLPPDAIFDRINYSQIWESHNQWDVMRAIYHDLTLETVERFRFFLHEVPDGRARVPFLFTWLETIPISRSGFYQKNQKTFMNACLSVVPLMVKDPERYHPEYFVSDYLPRIIISLHARTENNNLWATPEYAHILNEAKKCIDNYQMHWLSIGCSSFYSLPQRTLHALKYYRKGLKDIIGENLQDVFIFTKILNISKSEWYDVQKEVVMGLLRRFHKQPKAYKDLIVSFFDKNDYANVSDLNVSETVKDNIRNKQFELITADEVSLQFTPRVIMDVDSESCYFSYSNKPVSLL